MKRLGLRIDDDLGDAVELLSQATDTSVNQIVVDALEMYVEHAKEDADTRRRIRQVLDRGRETFGL